MTYNGIAPLWDLNLPPALPEISDDQFLALLNQQFETASPQDTVKHQQQPTANPQALSRFPVVNISPLVSEESSPSPPGSSTDPVPARSRRVSEHHRVTRSSDLAQNDEQHKRKASFDLDDDDDDEGQPQHKSFHGDQGSAKKSAARRKSAPNANQKDESRLLKRKEQNRAAQRAFRERKEKHVRDLEEKVAMLEAKSEMQAVENENLRDMLTRLQSENRSLKESSFTFSVPSGSTPADLRAAEKAPVSRGPQSPLSAAPSVGVHRSNEAASDRSQSQPLFEQNMAYFSPQFFNVESLPVSPPPPDLSIWGNMTPLVTPTQGPYITLASNPYTMSFAEPVPFSSFLADSQSTTQSPQSAAPPSGQGPDGAMSPRSLNDLFGGGFDSLGGFGNNFDVFSSNNNARRDTSSSVSSLSPVIHTNGSIQRSNSDVQPMDVQTSHHGTTCPKSKEDMAARISASSVGTFGPPVAGPTAASFAQLAASTDGSRGNSPFSRFTKAMSETGCDDDIPGRTTARTDPSPNNVPLNEAWERVKTHPQFSECDVDELCVMLTAKAKCDGSQRVLEPDSIKQVLSRIPDLAQQAQFRK